ncbi:MAG: trehalose-phosphatase, partial [Anaerolineae bacterium]
MHSREWVAARLAEFERLRLFLDYDGTLADFAPTPEHVEPDPELLELLSQLAQRPYLRVAVVSGRRLKHIQQLVPTPGILLAGTYGIELQLPDGERLDRLDYGAIRPILDALKPQWAALLDGRDGFFLEDKG